MLTYTNQLALLPAMDTEHIDTSDQHAGMPGAAVGNSYVLHLAKMGIREVSMLLTIA